MFEDMLLSYLYSNNSDVQIHFSGLRLTFRSMFPLPQEKVPQYQDKLRIWTRKSIIPKHRGSLSTIQNIQTGPPSRSTFFSSLKRKMKDLYGLIKKN